MKSRIRIKNEEIVSEKKIALINYKNREFKELIKCGRILTDYVNADSFTIAKRILIKGAQPIGKMFPKEFSREGILFPDDFYFPQSEMAKILELLRTKKNLSHNRSFKWYLKIYNSYFVRKLGMDKEGNIIKKFYSNKKEKLTCYHILAFNLVRFMELSNYSKYIHKCKCCDQLIVSEQKLNYDPDLICKKISTHMR